MGGSGTRAYNLAKGLLTNGIKVTVISGFPHYPTGNISKKYRQKAFVIEYFDKIKVLRTFIPPLESKGFTRRLFLFISFIISSIFPISLVGKIDGVIASNPHILSIFPSILYGFVHKCPIILNVDDLFPEVLYDLDMMKSKVLRKIGELIAKLAYSVADFITPISPAYIETIVNKYSINKSKVDFIPSGVDLILFPPAVPVINKVDEFKVLYIGTFSPAYDFDQVLRAAKLLEGEDKIRMCLQGAGEMAPVIRNNIKKLNLENVDLVEKIILRDEVAKVLMDADVLLLPLSGLENYEKGISSKLYEYQAASKPIICCSGGMSGRYISDTGSGIVVRPGDYEGLSKAVLYLRDNRDVADKLGASGRKYAENNLSIEKIGLKMMTALNYVCTCKSK